MVAVSLIYTVVVVLNRSNIINLYSGSSIIINLYCSSST